MTALDAFDRRLLALVQRDASLTSDELATDVGLSPSAIQRRLKRLRSKGVISGIHAMVEPAMVGRPMFFIVGLEIERERPELLSRLRTWLNDEDAVQEVFYVTGAADFIIVVIVRDIAAYDTLMARMLADNPNVRRFTTNVALSIHKRSLFLPIGEEEQA